MSLWVCECSTRYAVGLPACPHCGSTTFDPAHVVDRDGGERPSPGSSSSTSSANTGPTSGPLPVSDRRRARTAASPSVHAGASSTAPLVTGDRIGGES